MSVLPRIEIAAGASEIASDAWDACAGDGNPFASHAFHDALERSGSATGEAGWQPVHLVVHDEKGAAAAILPGYAKSHSQGEYVFDHAWADALHRAGGRYYPKLQHAVPFTSATAPKLLTPDAQSAQLLIAASQALAEQNRLSSAHATFLTAEDARRFEDAGWLLRHDIQFHFINRGYRDYADVLAAMASRKRKALRKEREAALAGGIEVEWVTGRALTERHWDAMWDFYQDTGSRKWGRPYLTRNFFSMIGESLRDRILLVLALRRGRAIAGALNFIGSDTLFGRYWGCIEQVPALHFELCYHQAIDFALEHGLARVEAGAQGPHKLARGYEPVATTSAHWIANRSLRTAIADFLMRERAAVADEIALLAGDSPFKTSGCDPRADNG